MLRRKLSLAVLLAVLTPAIALASATIAPARAAGEASAVVERLNATLLQVMQNADELGYRGRYETLAPVLADVFNFPLMASTSVGSKHWRSLETEQKKELTQAFGRLSVATFASRFDGYGGEQFRISGERELGKNILVLNELVKQSGEAISINYVVRNFDGRHRIVDVYLDGKYSELALKRSEYGSVIKLEGFTGLLAALQTKIDQYAAGS